MRATSVTGSPVPGRRRDPWGFTLIELLVVLAILALLAGLVPLALDRAIPGRRVESAARRVVGAIRDAQSGSLISGRSASVELEAGGNALRAGNLRVAFAASTRVALFGPEGQPLTALHVFPDGSAQAALIKVTDEGHARTVVVSGLTGEVRVEDAR